MTRLTSSTSNEHYLRLKTALEMFDDVPNKLTTDDEQKLLQLVSKQQEFQQAILDSNYSSRVHISFQQVTHAVQALEKRFPNATDFDSTLAQHGLNRVMLREALETELQCDATLEIATHNLSDVSDEEAQSYYFANLEKFEQPERRQASHILITINSDFPDNTPTEALKRIEHIRLQATPENFPQLALRHSECPTAMNSGVLGLVERKQLHPPLDKKLFSMSDNSFSEPIETEIGYHLLWCQQIHEAHRISFSQSKDQIKQGLLKRQKAKVQKAWLQQILTN